jgi:hypothetical protein
MSIADYYPTASRPLEYVAFWTVQMSTKEGPAFVFLAVDAFSGFAFNLVVEKDGNSDRIIEKISQLTENADFIKNLHRGFTLVLENAEALQAKIESIIKPLNGSLMIDKSFCQYLALLVMRGLRDFMFGS